MKIVIIPVDCEDLVKRFGLHPGGKAQKFWTSNVQRRMKKYLPFRDVGAVLKAVDAGATDDGSAIVVRGPQMRYLYQGKVMVGKVPKRAIDKDLRYTKTHNAKAGPLWDRRLKADEGRIMRDEFERYLRNRI